MPLELLEFVAPAALRALRQPWHVAAGLPDLPPPVFPEPPRRWVSGEGYSWRWLILLDGERVEQALTADVDTGCVTEAVPDANGFLDVKAGYPTRTCCGAVEVVSWREWREAEAAWYALGLWVAGAGVVSRNHCDSGGEE